MIVIALISSAFLAIFWQYTTVNKPAFLPERIGKRISLKLNWIVILGFVTFLPLYLVFTLQYAMHDDYNNYARVFLQVKSGTQNLLGRDMIAFWIFKAVGILNLNFQFVYAIIYFISFAALAKCIHDYSSNWAVSILLFFSIFFILGFVQLRQLPAVMMALYAYRYIHSKRIFSYCFCILVATCFHLSALIMLPFYYILQVKLRASYYAIIFGIFAAFNMFQRQIIEWVTRTFMPWYLGRHEMFRGTTYNKTELAIIIMVFILVLMYYVPISGKKDINQIFINCFFIAFIIFFTFRWIPEFDRFGYYFYVPVIALIPNMLNCDANALQRRFMLIAVPVVLAVFAIYRYSALLVLARYTSVFG